MWKETYRTCHGHVWHRHQTLQQTATHCSTLQHIATHCNTLQHSAIHCNTLQHTATHCNTLQHVVDPSRCIVRLASAGSLFHESTRMRKTHCNTLQHTATHCKLQVSFQTRSANSRALLQKRPEKIRHSVRLRHPLALTACPGGDGLYVFWTFFAGWGIWSGSLC